MTIFTPANIAALIIASSFAAGLNVYATVLTLGLLSHTHAASLPPGLEMLGQWWVIGLSGAMFALEFVADKIPGFDMVWNALHTFVRPPIAALIAYQASAQLSPGMKLAAALAGGGIALVSHGSKTAVRAAVTPSPEPVSNIALSTSEDVLAVGLTWLTTKHPWIAAAIAATLIICAVFAVRWSVRLLKKLWTRRSSVTSPASTP
ncbi:MAG: DUF4126 domain-containing protein [Silvibacterium sp.]|nr:DUF4126 domain-containing protein [Silvibacterium sp.]MBV8438316.1 DUF4126 domain-containing protein [Silvibacterium sp.]